MTETIEQFLERDRNKELLRFTTAGSVDDGKSTLIGRLLFDSKSVYEDQLASVRKASVNRNAGPVDFSLLTDGLRAEREQGITIDVAYRYFSTSRRKFIIADTPGHEQYTRNMATGASTAELAIVLVDARKGVLPQSRRHAYIASLLGIRSVIVAVNKMDLVGYSRERFEEIREEFLQYAASLDFRWLRFVPISALEGDNVTERSARTPWYKDAPLLELLETAPAGGLQERSGEFRFPVQLVIRPTLDFRGYAGQIASGVVRSGDPVAALPAGRLTRIRSITTFDGELEEAHAPMAVTLTLEDEIDISRGDMLIAAGANPHITQSFDADLVWMNAAPLSVGRPYLIKHGTRQTAAAVSDVLYRTDVQTLEPHPAEQLALNEIGRVRIEARKPLFFDAYRMNRETGAFIVIDPESNLTVAAGMIVAPATTTKGRVTLAERRKRQGHTGARVWVGPREQVAYEAERALFDRGCNVCVVRSQAGAAALDALREAGVLTLVVGAEPVDADLAAPHAEPADMVAELERSGLLRRDASGLFGDGI